MTAIQWTNEQRIAALESLLYDAVVELSYVQEVENCDSGLCASGAGEQIVKDGMALLGVKDLSAASWEEASERVAGEHGEGR